MERKKISSNTKWESIVGYSRAIRVGSNIYVSGTTATNKFGKITGKRNPYKQTVQAIKNIESALKQFDSNLENVVRTRIFVANIKDWKKIAKAYSEFFDKIRPTCTMVEVNRFIDPAILLEIEVEAVM